MKQISINVITGERQEVEVCAYRNAENQVLVLPQDEAPPPGYTSASQADIRSINTPAIVAKITAQIKAKRDRFWEEGGVKVGEHWFSSSKDSISTYNTLLQVSADAPNTTVLRANWRTKVDGVTVSMTRGLVLQILQAGVVQFSAIDDAAQAHILALSQSANPDTYDYSSGWPAIFEDPSRT